MLMINDNNVDDELLLHDNDYPNDYINKAHITDYKLSDKYIIPERIFNKKSHHNRLLLRISWKVKDGYIPMTFVCDTGAPMNFYISDIGKKLIITRINEDELQTEYVVINNKKFTISNTPLIHENSNIIGLCLLDYWELKLKNGEFMFDNLPNYL